MTAEYVFRAALRDLELGRTKPHCFSAHIPGKGYTNRGETAADDMAEYFRQAHRSAEFEFENMGVAEAYAERGYTDPKRGILFANWNHFPPKVTDLLERMGYAIEWSDEWSTCDDCGKAVRTSPDSYGWRASFYLANECEIICHECVTSDPDVYVEAHLNNTSKALTIDVDLAALGFERINADHFENGLHPGQNDDPKTIAKNVPAGYDFVFAIPSVGQFDINFDLWIRPMEQD